MFNLRILFIRYLLSLPNTTLILDYEEGFGEIEGILKDSQLDFYYTFDLIDFSQLDSFNLNLSNGSFLTN